MIQMAEKKTLIFRYGWYSRLGTDIGVFVFIPAILFFNIHVFFFYQASDVIEARIVMVLFLLYSPMYILTRIYTGDVHIDDIGISRWLWGRKFLFIAWDDVKAATLDTIYISTLNPPQQTAGSLYRTDRMSFLDVQLRGIRFDTGLPNGDLLLDYILQHLREHNVKIIDRRKH